MPYSRSSTNESSSELQVLRRYPKSSGKRLSSSLSASMSVSVTVQALRPRSPASIRSLISIFMSRLRPSFPQFAERKA